MKTRIKSIRETGKAACFVLLSAFLMMGCEKEETPQSFSGLKCSNGSYISALAMGERDSLTVFSNMDIFIDCNASWITFADPVHSGYDNSTQYGKVKRWRVEYYVHPNDTRYDRSCEIVVRNQNSTKSITCQQGFGWIHVDRPGTFRDIWAQSDFAWDIYKITGQLNDNDFGFIRRNYIPTHLDISGVTTPLPKIALCGMYRLKTLILPENLREIPYMFLYMGNEVAGKPSLERIEIPASVEIIGGSAFYNCSSLAAVTFEDGSRLKTIRFGTFQNCAALESITIPSSVDSVSWSIFEDCSSLKTVTFESGSALKSIELQMFYNCSSLERIEIPASVETIGSSAFEGCSSLTTVTFEKGSQLKTIRFGTFQNCAALESITIPSSVDSVSWSIFEDCSSLKTVTFESGSALKSIELQMFYNCSSLERIEIPASVETIGSSAFEGCSSLTTVTFEKGSQLKTIGGQDGRAFSDCPKLMTVDASACTNVDKIREHAFYNSKELKLFMIGTATPPKCEEEAFSNINPDAELKVPHGCVEAYRNAEGWKEFANITELDE